MPDNLDNLVSSWDWRRRRSGMVPPQHFEFIGCGELSAAEILEGKLTSDTSWYSVWMDASERRGFCPMKSTVSDPDGKYVEEQMRYASQLSSQQVNQVYLHTLKIWSDKVCLNDSDNQILTEISAASQKSPFVDYPLCHQFFVNGLFGYAISFIAEDSGTNFREIYEDELRKIHGKDAVVFRAADLPESTRNTSWPTDFEKHWPPLSNNVFELLYECAEKIFSDRSITD